MKDGLLNEKCRKCFQRLQMRYNSSDNSDRSSWSTLPPCKFHRGFSEFFEITKGRGFLWGSAALLPDILAKRNFENSIRKIHTHAIGLSLCILHSECYTRLNLQVCLRSKCSLSTKLLRMFRVNFSVRSLRYLCIEVRMCIRLIL